MAIVLGKLPPDGSALLKIYSGFDSASKPFDVSNVTINSGFSRTGCCLSKALCDCLEESQ